MLEKFKEAVDRFPATLISNDVDEAYKILNLDQTNGIASGNVTKKIYENVSSSISLKEKSSDNDITKNRFMQLKNELVYRYVIYNEEPLEYLKVLDIINDSCRKDTNYIKSFTDLKSWEEAIVNCKNFSVISPTTFSRDTRSIEEGNLKEFHIATSVKYLIEKGCEIEIKDSDIHIVKGLEPIIDELNEKVKLLGGLTIIKSVFNHLRNSYSNRLERYFVSRETNGYDVNQKPKIPIGYLLNLSLKYPHENLNVKNAQKKFDEILELSTIIVNGCYGVQPYNFWEYHFQSGETIIKFCIETALWDSLFNFPQGRPSNSLDIADKLFSFIDESMIQTDLGFSKENIFEVAKTINEITPNPNQPTIIYVSALTKKLKHLNQNSLLNILIFLSHTKTVNENYLLPADYTENNFFLKPLIRLTPTKFILMNKSWCSPNYFEVLATYFRAKFKSERRDLDVELGNQLEFYLQNKLTEKGINFSSGNYKIDGIEGECDLIIECKDEIILIEIKKKSLTRKAKSGIDIDILIDLAESILYPQLQAGRTEIFLREKGSITLIKEGVETTIILDGRRIERIALTQLDFGGFQDRAIMTQFLNSLLTHTFGTHSEDKKIVKKFQILEEKRENWVEQYNKLMELDERFAHYPFFNCNFISLPQLLEVINVSNSNESFCKSLSKTKYVSLSTLDWYLEFNHTNQMDY